MSVRHACILITIFLFCACKEKPNLSIQRGFYFWQTTYHYNSMPNNSLWQSMQADKLYLRCFDVSWSEEAQAPVKKGVLNEFPSRLTTREIIPVVFISNKTFQQIKMNEVEHMAVMTYRHLRASISDIIILPDEYSSSGMEEYENQPYHQKSSDFQELAKSDSVFKQQYRNQIKEIQFDCDWTPSTKEKYFAFLKKMKHLFADKRISCTIRLYPFKYPKKAGVPPIDRGMLMCYNAGDVKDINAINSLFNKNEVLAYFKGAESYPLIPGRCTADVLLGLALQRK